MTRADLVFGLVLHGLPRLFFHSRTRAPPPRKSTKNDLTIERLSLGTHTPTQSFDLPSQHFAGSLNLKCVPVSGTGTES